MYDKSNDKLVELANCVNQNSTTGQRCVDVTCTTCRGTSKYWRENGAIAAQIFNAIDLDLQLSRDSFLGVGAFASSFLLLLSQNIFEHGCDSNPYPCQFCDRFGTIKLFADLVQHRAEVLINKTPQHLGTLEHTPETES